MTSPQITLTDRYIAALQQQLPLRPLSRRRDIDIELRALIADAIEHRVSAGSSQAQAEFDAVAELGNPARLAADYSDRPTALLGAEIFPDYRRLMRILLSTVIPGIAVMLVVAQLLAGRGWPEVLATTIAITATVAMHALFWTTLLFVILERVPSARAKALADWEPSALPETPDGREGIGETIAGIAFVLGFLALLVVSPTLTSAIDSAGNPIGLISQPLSECQGCSSRSFWSRLHSALRRSISGGPIDSL